jgi:hypothetical protein
MTMTDQGQTRTNIRRVSTDALIVRGLFVVTAILLVASAITGWREAHRAPAAGHTVPVAEIVSDLRPAGA